MAITGLCKSLDADDADLGKMLSASGMKPAELKQVVSGQQLTSKKNVLDEGENVTRSWFDESGLLLIAFSFLLLPEHFCGDALM